MSIDECVVLMRITQKINSEKAYAYKTVAGMADYVAVSVLAINDIV